MSCLPIELYRPIISHMHPEDDAATLLSLALSSQAFRYESQSVLFRVVFRGIWTGNMKPARDRQLLFLEAIINSPRRLAPLVRSYNHWEIESEKIKFHGLCRVRVVHDLISKALKFMVNLRDLRLMFSGDWDTLKGCAFQLRSLQVWGMPSSAAEWLSTQSQLRHLDASLFRVQDASVARRIAPTLQSIIGNRDDLYILAPGRIIIAFDHDIGDLFKPTVETHDITAKASGDIKYLRVFCFNTFFELENKHRPFKRLIMIEIWDLYISAEFLEMFSRLPPSLHVLVIYDGNWVWHLQQLHLDVDIKVWLARNLFSILPRLHYLDIRAVVSKSSPILESRYHRPTSEDAAIHITKSTVEGFWADGDNWWRYHDLELQRLSHN